MKRTEQAALKAFPDVEQPVWDESYPKTLFVRHTERNAFIQGYEQGEKDTIERAINVLNKQIDDLFYSRLTIGDFLKQFRKAMDEEQ